jgi:DNA-binding beta-propeller fold protein YncE
MSQQLPNSKESFSDQANHEVITTQKPSGLAIYHDGNIDTSAQIATIPRGIAILPDCTKVYVAHQTNDYVAVILPEEHRRLEPITILPNKSYVLADSDLD